MIDITEMNKEENMNRFVDTNTYERHVVSNDIRENERRKKLFNVVLKISDSWNQHKTLL